MKKRHNETEYQEIKKVLLSSSIHSKEQIDEKMLGMLKSAKLYSLLGFILTLTLSLILPRFTVFIVLLFCLFLAWLWSSTLSSKHYFQRYIDEMNQAQNEISEDD